MPSNSNMVTIPLFAVCYSRVFRWHSAKAMFTPPMFSRRRNVFIASRAAASQARGSRASAVLFGFVAFAVLCISIYIYIYIEREREMNYIIDSIEKDVYVHIHMYIYVYILLYTIYYMVNTHERRRAWSAPHRRSAALAAANHHPQKVNLPPILKVTHRM